MKRTWTKPGHYYWAGRWRRENSVVEDIVGLVALIVFLCIIIAAPTIIQEL